QFLGGALGHLFTGPGHDASPLSHHALAHGALLDVFDRVGDVDHAIDVDAGRHDVIGIDLSRLDQMLNLGDSDLAGSGDHRIEVPRGLPIDEIALGIALPRVHDRQVGDDAAFHDVSLAVEFA